MKQFLLTTARQGQRQPGYCDTRSLPERPTVHVWQPTIPQRHGKIVMARRKFLQAGRSDLAIQHPAMAPTEKDAKILRLGLGAFDEQHRIASEGLISPSILADDGDLAFAARSAGMGGSFDRGPKNLRKN